MKNLGKTVILIVLLLSIAQTIFLVTQIYSTVNVYKNNQAFPGTGKAAGTVKLCINTPPTINLSNCSSVVNQSTGTTYQDYTCWLSANNPENKTIDFSQLLLSAHRAFNDSVQPPFSVRYDGFISFTPTNDQVGNYSFQFSSDDQTGCTNGIQSEYFNLSVLNVNDAPYLTSEIPDQSLKDGEILHAFFLNNYFSDPDLDSLYYDVSATSSDFSIVIDAITSEVIITATTCDVSLNAMFIAYDPYNASNTSNLITIRCVSTSPSPRPGGGTGGGGGGGSGSNKTCKSEFECFDYYRCNRSNLKVQRCVDTNGCRHDVYLTLPCVFDEKLECNESWKCEDWRPCLPNGTQTRNCLDENSCETKKQMPSLVQDCTYIGTCNDGIRNCHDGNCEENIDCGGPCAACKNIEVPYPFKEEKGILIYVLTGIILLILTSILLYHYFHKEINAALAKAGWIITRRKKKQYLLSQEDKKKLLAAIAELEQSFDNKELVDLLNKYSELIRYYLIKVCAPDLLAEFDFDDLKAVLEKKKVKIREIIRKIFVSTYAKYLKVEQNKVLITKRNIILLVEELRNLVLQTSKVEPEDAAREVKELSTPDKGNLEKMLVMIINSYIALEFLELEVAKRKYLEILTEYEKLNIKEQEAIFEDVSRLYNNISYVNSWLEKPKEL
jgi:hypothetical protein